MSGEQGWRTQINAEDYFGQQQKAQNLADRRPVIRKASDLVGPGIADTAVSLTDFGDLLATYNGFFSAIAGAFAAPTPDESFVGSVVSDADMGGTQTFTGLVSGWTYQRTFQRNPSDPESIFWGPWKRLGGGITVGMVMPYLGVLPPDDEWLLLNGSTFDPDAYPDLFALLGSTTLPDLRDRTPYGVGSAWGLLATDGLASGSRTMNLYHVHDVLDDSAGSHTHLSTAALSGDHGHGGVTSAPDTTIDRATGGGTAAHPAHTHTLLTTSNGEHGHFISVDANGTHSHTGVTMDEATTGPLLRGVGMNWLVKARD